MIGYYYRPYLIHRRFSPTNLAMFYATNAVNDSGVLRLQDIIAS